MSVLRVARRSALAFTVSGVVCLAGIAGCQVSVKTKTRYTETNVTKEDTATWNGEAININIQGVGVAVNGGVNVVVDPSATKVKATANFLATSFQKSDADLSLGEAKNTFNVATSNGTTTVECGHGSTHGDSNGGESGCELVTITIPPGSAQQPLKLQVLGGNGTMTLTLKGAVVENVGANNKGDINAELPSTKGGNISLVCEQADDITATMPTDWAADQVVLNADQDKIANTTDAKVGAGAGGRGVAGTGLKALTLTSKSFAGSTGHITLR
jgi:hypothetical protein